MNSLLFFGYNHYSVNSSLSVVGEDKLKVEKMSLTAALVGQSREREKHRTQRLINANSEAYSQANSEANSKANGEGISK